ncbi:hypothetical protein GCM10027170_03310 [Aliiglaciecola aliphaticivorans]
MATAGYAGTAKLPELEKLSTKTKIRYNQKYFILLNGPIDCLKIRMTGYCEWVKLDNSQG